MTQLALCFAQDAAGRTRLAERRAAYPYSVTAPIPRADGMAQLTLQSISGGLYGGEHVGQHIRLNAGARARLVQPAATTVRRQGEAGPARQSIRLEAGAESRLIYCARPLILLPGAALVQDWEMTLAPGARMLVWDGFLGHAPGEVRAGWDFTSRVSVRDPEGRLRATERLMANGADLADQPYTAFGRLWCLGAMPPQTPLPPAPFTQAGITALPGDAGFSVAIAARDGGALCAAMDLVSSRLEGDFI